MLGGVYPRGRGNRTLSTVQGRYSGRSIPAWAGEPQASCSGGSIPAWAGEPDAIGRLRLGTQDGGSIPAWAGEPRFGAVQSYQTGLAARSIPAWAGEPSAFAVANPTCQRSIPAWAGEPAV